MNENKVSAILLAISNFKKGVKPFLLCLSVETVMAQKGHESMKKVLL
jgi:hypothetical protein